MKFYQLALVLWSTWNLLDANPIGCPDPDRNPLEETIHECDPKRPNLFIDRNNLLGKPAGHEHEEAKFDYSNGPNGPAHWAKFFKQCGGKHQSPINVDLSTIKTSKMPKLTWDEVYSSMPLEITVDNNGHSVVLKASFTNGSHPMIQGGPLSNPYYLDHIHFHWGTTDHKGSEHQINGKTFPMEMHAVHIKPYMKLEQAAKLPDGVVVIAYIFEIDQNPHKSLNYVQEAFELIEMDLNTAQPLQNMFPLCSLAEYFCEGYVTYKGSLTTPPCYESVTWIISPYTIGISKSQLEKFRALYSSSKNLENNFRPIQPLNGRVIHFLFHYWNMEPKPFQFQFQGYVTHKGSLTTPPCYDSVTWIISPCTIGISKSQLEKCRALYSSSKNVENNFRAIQPLNGRVIIHFVN